MRILSILLSGSLTLERLYACGPCTACCGGGGSGSDSGGGLPGSMSGKEMAAVGGGVAAAGAVGVAGLAAAGVTALLATAAVGITAKKVIAHKKKKKEQEQATHKNGRVTHSVAASRSVASSQPGSSYSGRVSIADASSGSNSVATSRGSRGSISRIYSRSSGSDSRMNVDVGQSMNAQLSQKSGISRSHRSAPWTLSSLASENLERSSSSSGLKVDLQREVDIAQSRSSQIGSIAHGKSRGSSRPSQSRSTSTSSIGSGPRSGLKVDIRREFDIHQSRTSGA